MLLNLYRNITEDGLIVSSSGFLVNNLVSKIEFTQPLKILEIGSGRGAFTREIIRRMCDRSELDICEIKADYNACVEPIIADHPCKTIRLHNSCILEFLTTPESYDVIVSSLPLKNFESQKDNNAFLHTVISAVKFSLKDGGRYLQYQYFKSNQSDIEAIFGKPMNHVDFVPLNILPAFVYNMTKGSDTARG
ncbi:MAG: methyltransferase [Natronospirillum sp.]|uniref:methyltransferase n=1 Tax=Natronospirillum sp. TaxID=2812955 RepID=UPI0025F63302|nr:methyltransferase [Natronospirillum sp.]MCH8551915.1 methyltransferase [Natronospirillum sp.]